MFVDILVILNPVNAVESIRAFLEAGGNVLFVIMIATFIMWTLIMERVLYFLLSSAGVGRSARQQWQARSDQTSWYADAVRAKLVSEVRVDAMRNINMIKVMVAVAPLLGLLGTVTGMIEVFNVMAVTGSSNARLMAGGISKATIPTMAGLVASLSGILAMNILEARAKKSVASVADDLYAE